MAVTAANLRHSAGLTDGGVYFDCLDPASGATRPTIIMIHGGAHTGSCYLRTADGGPGWAYAFAARGHRVVVPDWPGCGRSGFVAPDRLTGETVVHGLGTLVASLPPPLVLMTHSMSGAFGWRLLELYAARIARVVAVAPAPPGNIQPEPEVLDESDAAVVFKNGAQRIRLDKNALSVADRDFVEHKLVGDGRFFPRDRIDAYTASLLPIAPRLLYERRNINGSQVRVRDVAALRDKRVLVLTGTNDLDHTRDADGAIVAWLTAAGAAVDFVYLGDRGIVGNGHMLMLEQNSDAVAALVLDWLERA
ncbi:MAG TPA: alpha/beta fold hydrolase [Stellaceae bacterium]|nr:alpha/beta fold hydrolase [Stellaceae bacterium]